MPKILIIDDEALIRKMLKKFLEMNGFQIIVAENGSKGIALFNAHHPDLIITDIIMPEKEGLEIIQEIRKTNPHIQIIAISGGGAVDPELYLDLAKKFGAQHSFSKPIDNEKLLRTIKKILS